MPDYDMYRAVATFNDGESGEYTVCGSSRPTLASAEIEQAQMDDPHMVDSWIEGANWETVDGTSRTQEAKS